MPTARRGIGDVLPRLIPAHFVALAFHQSDELFSVRCVAHTVVDDIHELQLFALTADGGVIFTDGHTFGFLSVGIRYEHRE